ncbi:hypothetical protein QYF36_012545 [Acer negundo]|nr:hypothetical protein QYF36_012545 [Acer negundo]
MGNPHVLVIPFPAHGHITPLLELSQQLVLDHGIKVTFVITEDNRQRVMHSLATSDGIENQIHLVSIPDDAPKSQETLFEEHAFSSLRGKVKQLIEQINASDSDKITCIVADFLLGWGMQMAAEKGVKGVVFSGNMAAGLVLISKIPNLIDDGIIDDDGNVIKKEMIKLSPTMPPMSSSHFPWASLGNPKLAKLFFEHASKNNESLKMADWVLCNSAYELEPETFDTEPKIRPIGPLLGSLKLSTNSRPEDSICLEWLDQQPPQSVIYVAFVEELLSNEMYKANALVLKEKLINSIKENGRSYNNLKGFVEWVKE